MPAKLSAAYEAFAQFCKQRREVPMVKHFTKDNLSWSSLKVYPESSFKGSDARLLLAFLAHQMANPL